MISRQASRFTTSVSSPWAACCARMAAPKCCCSLTLVIDASLISLSTSPGTSPIPMGLIPLQGATLPGIEKANRQDHQERQHGHQPGQTELTKHHRPGIQKCHFDIKDDKEHGDYGKFHGYLGSGLVDLLHTAFKRQHLHGRWPSRSHKARQTQQ